MRAKLITLLRVLPRRHIILPLKFPIFILKRRNLLRRIVILPKISLIRVLPIERQLILRGQRRSLVYP